MGIALCCHDLIGGRATGKRLPQADANALDFRLWAAFLNQFGDLRQTLCESRAQMVCVFGTSRTGLGFCFKFRFRLDECLGMCTFLLEEVCGHVPKEVHQQLAELSVGTVVSKPLAPRLLLKASVAIPVEGDLAKHASMRPVRNE